MYTDFEIKAYTYSITFLITGQIYYGVRYAKGCHPSELGRRYMSSSKTVKRLISEYGIEKFNFKVRKVFNDPKKARDFETKVLQRLKVKQNSKYLNKHDNTFVKCFDHAGEKNPIFGTPAPNRGKKHMPETVQKMIESHRENPTWLGKHLTEEHKNNTAKGQQGSKHRRFKGLYHTPYGTFESSRLAEHPLVSYKAVQRWCQDSETKISLKAISKSPYLNEEHLGKTFKEIGFWFESI